MRKYVVVPVDKRPYVVEVGEEDYPLLSDTVGGLIQEALTKVPGTLMIANEEGFLLGLPWNMVASEVSIQGTIVGNVVLVGEPSEEEYESVDQSVIDWLTGT